MTSRGKNRRKTCKICGAELKRVRRTKSHRGRVMCSKGHIDCDDYVPKRRREKFKKGSDSRRTA